MDSLPLAEVRRLVGAANASRDGDAARQLEAVFSVSCKLAVYGTLAPGQPNHHIVAPVGGDWSGGVIEGDLFPEGWGAILGYPAFRPRAGGVAVRVQVLTSAALPAAWPMLDEFEGPEYERILVPVFTTDARLVTVANVYAAK